MTAPCYKWSLSPVSTHLRTHEKNGKSGFLDEFSWSYIMRLSGWVFMVICGFLDEFSWSYAAFCFYHILYKRRSVRKYYSYGFLCFYSGWLTTKANLKIQSNVLLQLTSFAKTKFWQKDLDLKRVAIWKDFDRDSVGVGGWWEAVKIIARKLAQSFRGFSPFIWFAITGDILFIPQSTEICM